MAASLDRIARRDAGIGFRVLLMALGFAFAWGPGGLGAAERPRIQTNEAYVEDVLSVAGLPLDDPRATFAAIFESLPDQVTVYPTENYYYFSFFQRGVRYGGNIRLAAGDRDAGKLHFSYFEEFAEWRPRPRVTHLVLDAADGVNVERVAKLQYRVTAADKRVLFVLNDLSAVRPATMAPHEIFVGPVFDESATLFFLFFDRTIKRFRFVLEETSAADELLPLDQTDRILIGKRTGFAYYRDRKLERKILIGVVDANAAANNYLDGPFDQLPDNFIEGDVLRESIIAAVPSLRGKIDRFGAYLDGSGRYLIAPYLRYHKLKELLPIDRCAATHANRVDYYACFP
ncbi:MAG TPA: hypothetical protein VIV34_01780 [Pseudolabrys sp.]